MYCSDIMHSACIPNVVPGLKEHNLTFPRNGTGHYHANYTCVKDVRIDLMSRHGIRIIKFCSVVYFEIPVHRTMLLEMRHYMYDVCLKLRTHITGRWHVYCYALHR